jgi:hypothetical protein
MKSITFLLLATLITATTSSYSLASSKQIYCEIKIDGKVLPQKLFNLEHEKDTPEGSGSAEIYREDYLRIYFLNYPADIVIQYLSFNDVVERTINTSALTKIYYMVKYSGTRSKLDANVEGRSFSIKCNDEL